MHESRWNDGAFTTQLESLVWTASPIVRRYLHRLATGDPACDWLTAIRFRYLPGVVRRALVLGCGSGWLERALATKGGGVCSIIACDVARETVDRARARAVADGKDIIEYRVVDLEHEQLPEGPFDAIIANDVLHHITGLERLYPLIHDALSPHGRFVFNEYVGPNRFQYDDARMELINRYFRLFPDRLRWDPVTNSPLWKRTRIDSGKLVAEDPTEAVRSEDVLPLARSAFSVVAEIPYGGGLLNPLLFGVIAGFQPGRDDRLLDILCAAEDRLTEAGALEPDFHIFVGARRRPGETGSGSGGSLPPAPGDLAEG
jgi:SAM-dependent methyltransferase